LFIGNQPETCSGWKYWKVETERKGGKKMKKAMMLALLAGFLLTAPQTAVSQCVQLVQEPCGEVQISVPVTCTYRQEPVYAWVEKEVCQQVQVPVTDLCGRQLYDACGNPVVRCEQKMVKVRTKELTGYKKVPVQKTVCDPCAVCCKTPCCCPKPCCTPHCCGVECEAGCAPRFCTQKKPPYVPSLCSCKCRRLSRKAAKARAKLLKASCKLECNCGCPSACTCVSPCASPVAAMPAVAAQPVVEVQKLEQPAAPSAPPAAPAEKGQKSKQARAVQKDSPRGHDAVSATITPDPVSVTVQPDSWRAQVQPAAYRGMVTVAR
jgi:hypothetical protein